MQQSVDDTSVRCKRAALRIGDRVWLRGRTGRGANVRNRRRCTSSAVRPIPPRSSANRCVPNDRFASRARDIVTHRSCSATASSSMRQGSPASCSTDAATKRAWVWSGTRIYALGRALHDQGLACATRATSIARRSPARWQPVRMARGAALQNLSASVIGIRLVAASGGVVECSAQQNAELFRAARLNLGAFGVVTATATAVGRRVSICRSGLVGAVRNADAEARLADRADAAFRVLLVPATDARHCKAHRYDDAEPVYPLARRVALRVELRSARRTTARQAHRDGV